MVNKKKIMIIEDQALLNNMLKNTLSNDYDIVCTCTSAKDMMNLYKIHKPDLILTDVVTKEGANGIEYAKEVKDKYHNKVKILAITGVPEITFLNTAKEYNLDENIVVLSAQEYVKEMYSSVGFKVISDVYNEVNIPHVKMKIEL